MSSSLTIIAMIPARYAASRFPGKMMKDLAGKPLIVRTYEQTVATGLFQEVYVVTDHQTIYDTITAHGGKAIMSQKDHACGSDRIAEAVAEMEVLRSRSLANRVVERLNLTQYEEFNPSLRVKEESISNLQHISEREPDDWEEDPSLHPTTETLFMEKSKESIQSKYSIVVNFSATF